MKLSTKQIALTSIFAGLYYLFSFLPGIPVPGLADLKIQVGATMATVFGYVLGPFLGAVSTFSGVFLSWLLPPGRMAFSDLLFIPSPVLNAIVSGLLFQRRWKVAAAVLGILTAAFWFTPPVQPVTDFWNIGIAVTFDKIIALFLIGLVIIIDKRIQKVEVHQEKTTKSRPRLRLEVLRLFIMAFIGNESDNMWGSLIFAVPFVYQNIYQIQDVETIRFLFLLSPFAYPVIRFIQAIIATLVSVPLMRILRTAKFLS